MRAVVVTCLLAATACAAPAPVDALPDVALVDQDGHAFALKDLASSWVLLSFVYTRCPTPDLCPRTMQLLREVQTAAASSPGPALRLLTITLDPVFDSPAVLKEFATVHGVDGARWTLATAGSDAALLPLSSSLNVLALPARDGTVSHNVKVALLRPGLVVASTWPDNRFDPKDVLHGIHDR